MPDLSPHAELLAGHLQVSNSELQTAQRCPRLWALTYHWRWQIRPESAAPTSAAGLGGNVHLALEAWYRHGLDPCVALRRRYELLKAQNLMWVDLLDKERDLGLAMLEGFVDWAAETGLDAAYEVLDVERELRFPIHVDGHRVTLRARLDQLVRDRLSGAYLVRDWKTVSSLAKANQLVRNQQMRFYALLLSLIYKPEGIQVGGALYVMIKKSKRTARAAPPFYDQVLVTFNRHDLNATWQRVKAVTSRIVDWHVRLEAGEDHHGVVYPNATDFCDWGCPFRDVCPMLDDGSRVQDALQASFVQAEDPYHYYERDDLTPLLEVR